MTLVLVCVLAVLSTGLCRFYGHGWGRAGVVVLGTMVGTLALRGALGALLLGIDPAEAAPLGGSGMMLLTFMAWWTAPNDTTLL